MITIYLTDETFKFDNKTIETVSSVELLCVQLDDRLNFSLNAGNIGKSIANQLSALIRLNNYFYVLKEKGF